MLTISGLGAAVGIVVLLGSSSAAGQAAQAGTGDKTVWDGVYSEEQSLKGQEVSKASCVTCHGEGLGGSDLAPALMGPDFVAAWSGRSVGELYEKIHTTMPADGPGTLKPQQSASLVAYILKLNEFPAGTEEVGTDLTALNQFMIRSKKP
jgi:mono/diheme cytochrome c family protein